MIAVIQLTMTPTAVSSSTQPATEQTTITTIPELETEEPGNATPTSNSFYRDIF